MGRSEIEYEYSVEETQYIYTEVCISKWNCEELKELTATNELFCKYNPNRPDESTVCMEHPQRSFHFFSFLHSCFIVLVALLILEDEYEDGISSPDLLLEFHFYAIF